MVAFPAVDGVIALGTVSSRLALTHFTRTHTHTAASLHPSWHPAGSAQSVAQVLVSHRYIARIEKDPSQPYIKTGSLSFIDYFEVDSSLFYLVWVPL